MKTLKAHSQQLRGRLRPCVETSFDNGANGDFEFHKMRHALIAELQRLGYGLSEIKHLLIEWNSRCKRPRDKDRYLLKYISWFVKQKGKTGCKALSDFCIGQERCWFYLKSTDEKRKATETIPFDLNLAAKHLEDQFKAPGLIMTYILRALRRWQIEKDTGEMIFIGYRRLSSYLKETQGHNVGIMAVCRGMNRLIELGMVTKVEKGKPGIFGQPANGYQLAKWQPPCQEKQETGATHTNSIVYQP
jgi:hypothetical protein